MTFYSSLNSNHQAIIDLITADSEIQGEVAHKNIIDYDYELLSQKRFPAIVIPSPMYTLSEVQGTGLVIYDLRYFIYVASDYIGPAKSKVQLQTIATRVMEILGKLSNIDLGDTCTYTNLELFNPNFQTNGSEKAMQRIGEIRFVTSHGIPMPV